MKTRLEIEPARAKRVSDNKLAGIWNSHGWTCEEKFNGWRYLLHFGRKLDRPYLTGRRISSETGLYSEKGLQVPQLWPTQLVQQMDYTVLDGEIFPPEGANFRDIASIMNSDFATAQERIKHIGAPTYRVFDIVFSAGADVRECTQIERRILLEKMVVSICHPLIMLVPQFAPDTMFYDEIVARGGEGVILKDLSASYGEGWVKVKREHTLDVVVTGFTDAKFGKTGKYHGQIGAVVCSVYSSSGGLLEVAQVSGMDDATRQHITNNKGEWLGKTIEIVAQEWAKNRLAHPRFVRARPDTDPRSCTFKKMLIDLGEEEKESCDAVDDKQLRLL